MKVKKCLICMVALCLFMFYFCVDVSADLTDGLVAYYPFNGNANDESVNENHGTVYGATLCPDRFGNTNSAYCFDGNDYIKSIADDLPTAERTVSLWFNASVVDDIISRMLIGYGGNPCGTTWMQGITNTGVAVGVHCDMRVSYYIYQSIIGTWVHWVITTHPSGTKIYINGELKSSDDNYFDNTNVTETDLAIGVTVSPNGIAPYTDVNVTYFNGKIDDVRIYNRALSDNEICLLYDPSDTDNDGITNCDDNCPETPNGPNGGTCTLGDYNKLARPCMDNSECGTDGFCSMNKEDTDGDGIGDACDLCEGDFDCDADCDGLDLTTFLNHFGRGQYDNPCTNLEQCKGDFLCDGDVDAEDVTKALECFGRGQYFNPCPPCEGGDWCEYP